MITAGGTFTKMVNRIGSELNTSGAAASYVDKQMSFNSDKIDALNSGLGSLIDADLAKESAQLQALPNSPAARNAGALDSQPGAADPSEPLQVASWRRAAQLRAARRRFRH